jgi:hypothetical protein
MKEEQAVGRREFTLSAALAALSGVAITISACGGGGGGSPTSPSTPTTPPPAASGGDQQGLVATNHGHAAVITAARLASPADVSLDIRGTSDHPHTVTLSAAQVSSIAANQRISMESTTDDGHSHTVTFN